jgi:hypothetical protein
MTIRRRQSALLGKLRALTFVAVLINILIAVVSRIVDSAVADISLTVIADVCDHDFSNCFRRR